MWIDAITDRVAQDIIDRDDKAFFNIIDWVRINNNAGAVIALGNMMRDLSIPWEYLPLPTIATIPTVTEINDFIDNINIAFYKDSLGVPDEISLAEFEGDFIEDITGNSPDYENINDWEQNIELVRDYLIATSYYTIRSGVSTAGSSRLWQVRFRQWPWVEPDASPTRIPRTCAAYCGTGLTRQNAFREYA